MKTVSTLIIRAVAVLGLVALPARAYNDSITHPELTNFAFEKSNLIVDPTLLPRIGMYPWERLYVGLWLRFGAYYEDRFPRGSRHFFDPISGQGLTGFSSSPTWVLENESLFFQDNSLADGREALTRALTFNEGAPAASEKARQDALADVFIDLGGAVHHLQDMTQPQHVRNDDHLDMFPFLIGLYDPSLYEKYTKERNDRVLTYGAMGSPVFPGKEGLAAARDFWSNTPSKSGVAQFTNLRFVSKGTNFCMSSGSATTGTYDYPTPGVPTPYTVEALYQESGFATAPPEIQALCGSPATGCTMMEYPASYDGFITSKASTHSIFDQDLKVKGLTVRSPSCGIMFPTSRVFSLNRFNFDAVHEPLLSTAVGYSAGFINHFFRGKLKVEPPKTGPYAAVDHQPGQGFTSIKATISNATPNEGLTGGNIVAVARFHLNNCYQADLSGEFQEDDAGNLIAPCPAYRSNEEHIRVSPSQPFSAASGALGQEYTFNFSDPIPISATDLVLQVYYQGQVGGEEKSFALGVADLSEPTFVTVLNGTDMFEVPTSPVGTFVYWPDIISKIDQYPYTTVDENQDLVPDVNVSGGTIAYSISVDGKKIGDVSIPQGRFARVAVLVKPTTFLLSLGAFGNGFFWSSDYLMPSKWGQLDPVGSPFYVSPVGKRRKQALHYTSVTYYHYYQTANAPLSSMDVSKEADATKLLPVTMVTPLSAPFSSPAPRPVASTRERPIELDRLRMELSAAPPVKGVARATSANLKVLVLPVEVGAAAEAR